MLGLGVRTLVIVAVVAPWVLAAMVAIGSLLIERVVVARSARARYLSDTAHRADVSRWN